MASFDFVTDDNLRIGLEADTAEMAACREAKAHKAVLVLAGSIVEAVLADHLASIGDDAKSKKSVYELDLGQLISAARSENVLSDKAVGLAAAVKTYRNLIHPGRLVRLEEQVDAHTAAIACELVEVIASEVAKRKSKTYGPTATQIVSKVENDSSSTAIVGDLIKATKAKELERLLLNDLPTRYVQLAAQYDLDETASATLGRFRHLYRAAFDALPPAARGRVTDDFARLVREGIGEFEILTRETAFFRGHDLMYVGANEAAMVARHLLSRVERVLPDELIEPLRGIGRYGARADLMRLMDAYARSLAATEPSTRRKPYGELPVALYQEAPDEIGDAIKERMGDWIAQAAQYRPVLVEFFTAQHALMVRGDIDDTPF